MKFNNSKIVFAKMREGAVIPSKRMEDGAFDIYACFEDLIFREYIWNRFNAVLSKEIYVLFWSVILFTLWHIGYMIPQIVAGNINAVFNY